ncbi:hypothetical protein [Pseudomonas sp. 2FE]|uniref:hypothetical protein n=1 Tax=Pseudomonas sp. 2FE TaxID=2502190 RepID=UPI0010F66F5D|nr:hypothetical protein [Pseudomonas sp. 2FE]
MDLTLVMQTLQRFETEHSRRPMKLVIPILKPGMIGGTPCVEVKYINPGFDWDQGKLMLVADQPLTTLSPEDVEAIRFSASKGQSWHAEQRNKALREENIRLKSELDQLRSQLQTQLGQN